MTTVDTSRMKLVRDIFFVWVEREAEQGVLMPVRSHWLSVSGHRVRVFPPVEEGHSWSATLYNENLDWQQAKITTGRALTESAIWSVACDYVMHGK